MEFFTRTMGSYTYQGPIEKIESTDLLWLFEDMVCRRTGLKPLNLHELVANTDFDGFIHALGMLHDSYIFEAVTVAAKPVGTYHETTLFLAMEYHARMKIPAAGKDD